MYFRERKLSYFHLNLTEICSQGSNSWYVSVGSDNGLAPHSHQAVILTNDDLVNWRIYASLSLDELRRFWAFCGAFSRLSTNCGCGCHIMAIAVRTNYTSPYDQTRPQSHHLTAYLIIGIWMIKCVPKIYAAVRNGNTLMCTSPYGYRKQLFSRHDQRYTAMLFMVLSVYRQTKSSV